MNQRAKNTAKALMFLSALSLAPMVSAQDINKGSVGADFWLSNSLSAGTFMGKSEREPSLSSSFYLYPYYLTSPLIAGKKIKFYGEIGLNVEWLDPNTPSPTNPSRTPSFSDLKFRAKMSRALDFKSANISVSPALKIEIPITSSSINANRVVAFGANFSATWSKWGVSLTYKPSITGYIHSVPYKSALCSEVSKEDNETQNVLANGKCRMDGRQTLALLKNGLFLGYGLGNHSLTTGVRTYHSFLRKADSGAKSEGKNYSFSTLGIVEYGYTVPVNSPLYLSLGIASYQPAFNDDGNFNFPFFDFNTPSNSEFYFSVELSV